MRKEAGVSPTIAAFLMVALLIIVFALLWSHLSGMLHLFDYEDHLAPPLIQVTSVFHTTPSGSMQDASRVTIQNTYTVEYKNRDLMAEFYKNHEKLYARIYTLHGEDFIPSHHFGVATIGGSGCRGDYFSPGEMIGIDLTDGYYTPGDLVELRIYQKSTDTSCTSLTGNIGDDEYMQDWLKENYYLDHKGYRIISQHQFRA